MKKKVLIGLLLICLVFFLVGYYYMTRNEDEFFTSPLQPTMPVGFTTPTVPPLQEETTAITKLGDDFYRIYMDCLANPPSEARGRVAIYCQSNTELTTETFVTNLKELGTARRGVDPITCAQNPPSSVTMGEVDYEDETHATLFALAQFGGSAVKIPVQVIHDGKAWKVDSVLCPKP